MNLCFCVYVIFIYFAMLDFTFSSLKACIQKLVFCGVHQLGVYGSSWCVCVFTSCANACLKPCTSCSHFMSILLHVLRAGSKLVRDPNKTRFYLVMHVYIYICMKMKPPTWIHPPTPLFWISTPLARGLHNPRQEMQICTHLIHNSSPIMFHKGGRAAVTPLTLVEAAEGRLHYGGWSLWIMSWIKPSPQNRKPIEKFVFFCSGNLGFRPSDWSHWIRLEFSRYLVVFMCPMTGIWMTKVDFGTPVPPNTNKSFFSFTSDECTCAASVQRKKEGVITMRYRDSLDPHR